MAIYHGLPRSRVVNLNRGLAAQLFTLGLFCELIAASSSLAFGNTIAFEYKEDNLGCKAPGIHGAVNANAVHNLTTGAVGSVGIGGVHWKFTGSLTETDMVAGVNNDKIVLDVNVQHISNPAPHAGEAAPNPNKPALNLTIEAGKNGITFATNPNPFSVSNSVDHNSHSDYLTAGGMVLVNINNKDIEAYIPILVTMHFAPAQPNDKKKGFSTLTPGSLAPNVFGGAVTLFQVSDRRFQLAIAVSNVFVASLVSAQIRQGTPLSPGPVILSLPNASFVDLPTLGMASRFDEFIFPSAYMSDLISGNTFVEVVTTGDTLVGTLNVSAIPDGGGGGPIPTLSEWGMIILGISLLSCAYFIIRLRARSVRYC